MTTLDARVDVAAVQRRTIGTLVAAQAVGAVGITIGIATASLLAEEVSGSERQAGLAQTFQVLGAAVMAFVLARVMARRGRRVGLVSGYLTGSAGAVLVVLAGVVDSMPLLLLGAALLGSSTAANSAARYAATDLAPAQSRARALSLVVWATTIGAVAGPNLTGLSADVARRLAIPELTGPFALAAACVSSVSSARSGSAGCSGSSLMFSPMISFSRHSANWLMSLVATSCWTPRPNWAALQVRCMSVSTRTFVPPSSSLNVEVMVAEAVP